MRSLQRPCMGTASQRSLANFFPACPATVLANLSGSASPQHNNMTMVWMWLHDGFDVHDYFELQLIIRACALICLLAHFDAKLVLLVCSELQLVMLTLLIHACSIYSTASRGRQLPIGTPGRGAGRLQAGSGQQELQPRPGLTPREPAPRVSSRTQYILSYEHEHNSAYDPMNSATMHMNWTCMMIP